MSIRVVLDPVLRTKNRSARSRNRREKVVRSACAAADLCRSSPALQIRRKCQIRTNITSSTISSSNKLACGWGSGVTRRKTSNLSASMRHLLE